MGSGIASAVWLIALVSPASGLLASTSAPQRSRLRATRAAVVTACKSDKPPMLGGRPLLDGDGVLINDNASQAWWRASIRETRGRQALIHYTGCDPAWDEWIDVDSPKLIRMDDVESRKDESAFQSDTAMEGVDDEELLEQYRQQRWEDNARWQLNTFAQAQLGSWKGTMDLYSLDAAERVKLVQDLVGGSCSSEARVCASNTIEIRDEMPAGASSLVVQAELGIQSFRPEVGNMAVASAFSLTCATSNASSTGGESDAEEGLLVEIALGEEQRRVRCKLLYAPPAVEGDEPGTLCVSRVAVVREVRGGGEFIDGNAGSPDIDGTPGRGLYDPPKVDKSRYISLYCEGGVTLVFPTAVPSGEGGVISLDWIAGTMRYQIDRKFDVLDGSLSSLELTEIRKADAEIVPPDFPHQSGGQ